MAEQAKALTQDEIRRAKKRAQNAAARARAHTRNASGNEPRRDDFSGKSRDREPYSAPFDPLRETFRRRFRETLETAVATIAQKEQWSPQQCWASIEYIRALTAGHGTCPPAPEDLGRQARGAVRLEFVRCCLQMQPTVGSFAGQYTDWYKTGVAELPSLIGRAA